MAAVSRFRPILMTTLTAILGVMPWIVLRDLLFYSLAVIIACGLAVGAVFTLGAVPVRYMLFIQVKSPVYSVDS